MDATDLRIQDKISISDLKVQKIDGKVNQADAVTKRVGFAAQRPAEDVPWSRTSTGSARVLKDSQVVE